MARMIAAAPVKRSPEAGDRHDRRVGGPIAAWSPVRWRQRGPVPGIGSRRESERRQPARGPGVPCSWALERRLSDRGDPRIEGELGERPRRRPYASDAGRNRGRFPSAPAGDRVRGQEPAVRLTRRRAAARSSEAATCIATRSYGTPPTRCPTGTDDASRL